MSQVICSNCGAEIPARNIERKRRLAHCPKCKTALSLAQRPGDSRKPTYPKQLERSLPAGLTVKETEDELIIIRPWARLGALPWMLVAFLCSGGMLISGLRLIWESFQSFIVAIFLLLGAMVGLYLVLTTLFNKTIVSLSPTSLEIKHGPIPAPFWAAFSLDASKIRQLYVDEKIVSSKSSDVYQYHLYALTIDYKHILLFPKTTFSEWDQALYLEQEIERYLGLIDQPFKKEPASPALDPLKGAKRGVWRKLAAAHQLDFVQRSPLKGAYLAGLYRGYYLELDTLSKKRGEEDDLYTRLLLMAAEPAGAENPSPQPTENEPLTLAQAASVLARPGPFQALKGSFNVAAGGQELYYEQAGVEDDYDYLQFLFDAFSDLLHAYPKIVKLGGETVPALQAILADESHPFHTVAPQLLAELAQATTQRWADQAARLRCSCCLGRCLDFQLRLSPLKNLTYYGCQSCRQSQQFFEFGGQVTAVLDNGMASEQIEQAGVLRVNWLARRTLFSFDAVEIIRATDEEVERFAVQVGNDTDPARQPRYEDMLCLVAAGCPLAENTLRILQQTFGQVNISTLDQQGDRI